MVRDKALLVDGKGLERHLGKVVGGRYAVVGYLGRGGMGVVYRAHDLRTSREVALKLLLKAKPTSRARRRFLREAKVAARLRHPNIVATYGFGRVEDGFYLAMELIEGQPLSRYWKRGIPFDALVTVCVQTLTALQAAHEAGVIHRDLKPGNILIATSDPGLIVKVVDFGLARFATPERDDLTRTGELVGTPRYMSPEQARGSRTIDATTDLYALGIVLYEFITGRLLFDAETATAVAVKHVTDPVPEMIPRKGVRVPAGFEGIVRKLLAKDPRARYLSAAAVRAALTPYLSGAAAAATDAIPLDPREFQTNSDEPPSVDVEVRSEDRGGRARPRPRLIGRERELRLLWEMQIRALETGAGAVIFLHGETGVGKTRLLEAFRDRVLEYLQMDWLEGVTRQGTGQGLWAVRQVLAGLFGLRNEGRSDAREMIRATMSRWGTPAESEVDRLADLLLPSDGDGVVLKGFVKDEEEDQRRTQRELLFGLVERVLRRAAAERPLVVVLEDLQWAGFPTQQFLEYFIPGLHQTPAPILLVATFRTDAPTAPDWLAVARRMKRYESDVALRIALRGLDAAGSRDMVLSMLNASEGLIEGIFDLSQGNPLHVVQVLRFLQDSDLLIRDMGVWELRQGTRLTDAVPPELADLLLARLAHLLDTHSHGEALTRIIERCAIIGRQVPYELLRTLLRFENEMVSVETGLIDHLDEALDFFVAEAILQENVESPDDVLEFAQGLLREVLSRRIRGRRAARVTHLAAARAREAYYINATDAHADAIADHYEAAREWEEALRWIVRAARVAHRAWDIKNCIDHFNRARDLMDRMPAVDPRVRREVAATLGEIYYTEGRYDEADTLFREAFELAEAEGETLAMAHLLFLRGDAARVLNDFEESESCYRECLAVSRALGDRAGIGRALLGLSKLSRMRRSLEESHDFLTAAEEQFLVEQDQWAIADARRQRAYIYLMQGKLEESKHFLEEALEIHRQFDDKRGLAYIQRDLANHAVLMGRFREAELQARKALDLFEQIGARFGFAQTLSALAEIHRAQGHLQASSDLHAKALVIFEVLNCWRDIAMTHYYLGANAFKQHRLPEAGAELTRALELAALKEFPSVEGLASAAQARMAARAGQLETARAMLLRAHQALAHETPLVPDLAEIYADCADAFEHAGEVEFAEECRDRATAIWAGLGRTPP